MKCFVCPRECGVDRDNGQIGACGVSNKIYVARVSLHMWEEPCISGDEGSGAVFFVGCQLGCIYCQNYEISGKHEKIPATMEYSIEHLAEAFLSLESRGANNINLVSPTHYSLQIIEAVALAKKQGLKIPVLYNCSGYEKVETLKMLNGIVDIYLTDFKYFNNDIAMKYSNVNNYVEVAKESLYEMISQQPQCEFNDKNMMTKGVIVRNLLLPGHVKNSKEIIKYVYETYGNSVYLSIMNQYTPLSNVEGVKPLDRKVTKREYNRLVDYVLSLGVTNAFVQEGDVAEESFIPDFYMK